LQAAARSLLPPVVLSALLRRGSWGADRRGVVIGTLMRARGCCSSEKGLWATRVLALLRVLVEAEEVGGYTRRELTRMVAYVQRKRGAEEYEWEFLWNWLKAHRRMSVWMAYVECKRLIQDVWMTPKVVSEVMEQVRERRKGWRSL